MIISTDFDYLIEFCKRSGTKDKVLIRLYTKLNEYPFTDRHNPSSDSNIDYELLALNLNEEDAFYYFYGASIYLWELCQREENSILGAAREILRIIRRTDDPYYTIVDLWVLNWFVNSILLHYVHHGGHPYRLCVAVVLKLWLYRLHGQGGFNIDVLNLHINDPKRSILVRQDLNRVFFPAADLPNDSTPRHLKLVHDRQTVLV